MIDNNLLDMENIKKQQGADDALLQQATKYIWIATHANALAQLTISYATKFSLEILQTVGKMPYQKHYCSQQLSGFTK